MDFGSTLVLQATCMVAQDFIQTRIVKKKREILKAMIGIIYCSESVSSSCFGIKKKNNTV